MNGRWATLAFEHNGIIFTNKEIDDYKKTVINKIYAALAIFEDCEKVKDFSAFYTYLNRICTEFNGVYKMFGSPLYITIVAILEGMSTKENLTHKEVKSLVFHCISTINKAR